MLLLCHFSYFEWCFIKCCNFRKVDELWVLGVISGLKLKSYWLEFTSRVINLCPELFSSFPTSDSSIIPSLSRSLDFTVIKVRKKHCLGVVTFLFHRKDVFKKLQSIQLNSLDYNLKEWKERWSLCQSSTVFLCRTTLVADVCMAGVCSSVRTFCEYPASVAAASTLQSLGNSRPWSSIDSSVFLALGIPLQARTNDKCVQVSKKERFTSL